MPRKYEFRSPSYCFPLQNVPAIINDRYSGLSFGRQTDESLRMLKMKKLLFSKRLAVQLQQKFFRRWRSTNQTSRLNSRFGKELDYKPIKINMEAPISGDSDLQRLREALQRVGGRSGEETILNNSESENSKISEQILNMEKLGLDDVGLLDLTENGLEDEDSWLYESPKHQATPAQKSISPYKYLHQNIDISDLNKVRGSLMAKLESIAAQEEYLSKPTPPVASSGASTNYQENIDDEDDDEFQGPVKRRGGTFSKPLQQNGTYVSSHVRPRGDIIPRRSGIRPRGLSNGSDDREEIDSDLVVRTQGGVKPRRSQYSVDLDNDINAELSVKPRGGVKPRGATAQPRGHQELDNGDDDMNSDLVVRPRGGVKPRGSGVQSPAQQQFDDDDDDCDDDGMNANLVVRPRGGVKPRGSGVQSPGQQQFDDDDDMKSDLVVRPRGGVKPRGSGVQPRGQAQYDVNDDAEDSRFVVKPRGGVKPRGAPVDTGRWDIPTATEEETDSSLLVRPRGNITPRGPGGPKPRSRPQQQNSFDADDNYDDEFTGPVRRRTFQMPVSQKRAEPRAESHRLAWQMGGGDEEEREVNLSTPGVRGEQQLTVVDVELEDDLELDNDPAPVVRRRGATPVNTNSSLPVKRRAGTPSGMSQLLASGITPPSSGLPTPVRSRLQAPESDVKRRSLPQAPTPRGAGQIKPRNSYSDNALEARAAGSTSHGGRRSVSPARFGAKSESPVVPRGSKLAAPRRIPAPRGSSPNDESWKEGCF